VPVAVDKGSGAVGKEREKKNKPFSSVPVVGG